MHEGELHCVADLLQLRGQAADVFVADVGDLFEDELFDFGPRKLLEDVSRLRVEQQAVTGSYRLAPQRLCDLDDALLVAACDDEGSGPVLEDLFQRHHLALELELAHPNDVQGLVQHHLAAPCQQSSVDFW